MKKCTTICKKNHTYIYIYICILYVCICYESLQHFAKIPEPCRTCPEIPQERIQKFPGECEHVPNSSWTCPGNIPDMSWNCPRMEMSRKFPGNVPGISHACPDMVCILFAKLRYCLHSAVKSMQEIANVYKDL